MILGRSASSLVASLTQFSLLCHYLGTFYSVLVLWLKICIKNLVDLVIINNGLFNSRYDAEAIYFDEGVRSAKRKQLEEKLLQVISLSRVFSSFLLKFYGSCFD